MQRIETERAPCQLPLPNRYQYSLDYYQFLFDKCLVQSEKVKDLSQRLAIIIAYAT